MSILKNLRTSLIVSGVLALIAGIVLLVWPGVSAVVVTGIFAAYMLVAGIVYVLLGLFAAGKGGWARVGYVLLGVLYIVAGVVAFGNLGLTTIMLTTIVTVFIGISWIVEGIVALSLLGQSASRGWTVAFAVLSLIAGVCVLFNVFASTAFFWIFLGISLVVLGIVQIIQGLTMPKDAESAINDIKSELS